MKEEIQEEIRGTILEGIDKSNLMHEVPEGYFERLSDEVIQKVDSEENTSKIVRLPQALWIGIAASVAIVLGFMVCVDTSNPSNNLFEGTDNETLIQYASLDMDLSDITIEDMVGEFVYDDFTDLDDASMEAYIQDHTDITELEEMLDYL